MDLGIISGLYRDWKRKPMTKPLHFEKSITELEELVNQLEKGELSLEDSLKQFEQGINLARQCQTILQQAEQKIEQLSAADKNTNE
jgi:exodeoxyribonuclease VII small subunit